MASMWGVASVGGPLVGGFVTDHLSWTYVFWINVPLGLAAMWLCNRALRLLPVRGGGGRIDYLGAALLTAGVTLLLLVLSWGGTEYPWASPTILAMTAGAATLFAALFWHERQAAEPILPPRLFADAVFSRGVCLAFVSSVGLLGTTFLLPLYFQLVRGAGASSSGLWVMPFMVANVLGAYLGGQIARWLGRTRIIIVGGLAATMLGYAGLATIGADTPAPLLVIVMMVVGCGIGVCLPTVMVMVQNAAPRRDVGTATGALLFLRSLGGAFGTTLVGAVLTLQFTARMGALGVPGINFGALREAGNAAMLSPAVQTAEHAALASGFRLAFGVLLVMFAGGILVAVGVRDLALRTTVAAEEEHAAIGH